MDWDFEWEFGPGGVLRGLWRALMSLASLLGGLILLLLFVAVAVLLIRYLLVATKAAQLYVDAHTPERHEPGTGGAATNGSATRGPEPTGPEPTRPMPPSTSDATRDGPTAAAAQDTATTTVMPDAPATAPTKPTRAPRKPKTPPTTPSTS